MGRPFRAFRSTDRTRNRRLAATAALAAAALTVTVPAAVADSGREVSRGVAIPAFYDPPAQLPAHNGALVRTEPMPLALSLPGLDGPLPGTATRLMYRSTDATGAPVAVTGAYIEPSAAWRGGGARPLVALASGTMGQGDQCAPSLNLQNPLTLGTRTVSVGYEDLAVYRLLAKGVAVVVTDYVGLGATDRLHTYVNRVDEGHALLDAARAALALPGTSLGPGTRIGLYGYSQGGGASAAAAELQPSYAPELRLSGAYVGAPPADLTAVIKGIDGSALAGALGWSINGLEQTYPAIRPIIAAHINSAGRSALADLSTMCVGDAILGYGFAKSSTWTTDGRSISDIIAADPTLQNVLAQQRIGNLKPTAPVRVATGVQDDIVVHAQVRQLALDWCRKGADVTYAPIVLPNLGDKLLTNHLAPLLTDQGDAISWLTDRLSGRSASSSCGLLPLLP
ncbi:lipase family protein [Streptacidiphilus monticola]|uniref:Lipase family protein n=1 Tax=Streptacidiphilus monticola TaxID=2161674 RepID=A0ABW1FYB0_9ACTN